MSWENGADLLGPCFQTLFQSKEVPLWIFGFRPCEDLWCGGMNSLWDGKGLKTAGPDRHRPSGDREDQRIRRTRERFPHCVFTVYLCVSTIPRSSILHSHITEETTCSVNVLDSDQAEKTLANMATHHFPEFLPSQGSLLTRWCRGC